MDKTIIHTRNVLFFAIVFLFEIAFAQMPSKLAVSPEAASLGKYVDFPISLHTGTPAIGIDLYQLSTYNYKHPIALNYHASGVKVQEIASRQGIGWSLQAGGIITCIVNNKPDLFWSETNGHGKSQKIRHILERTCSITISGHSKANSG
ncbi:MAG: hypothetical protein ACKO96_42140 [Flammeovirgaceae bacterium]